MVLADAQRLLSEGRDEEMVLAEAHRYFTKRPEVDSWPLMYQIAALVDRREGSE